MEIVVEASENGLRLDVLLVRRVPRLSRHKARELIHAGRVCVNGRRRAKGSPVRAGERVKLDAVPVCGEQPLVADPELSLPIAYEDQWLVVVDKPAGTPSHPLRAGELGTVAGALVARYPEMQAMGCQRSQPREAGLVHRLDVQTSGLLIAARDHETFEKMRSLLRERKIDKRYCALCQGQVRAPQRIDSWLISDRKSKRRVKVSERPRPRGRRAVTEILSARPVILRAEAVAYNARQPAEPSTVLSLVEIRVRSAGRHQIRAHLTWAGHPLAGDSLYGGPAVKELHRHFLHASELRFRHPAHGGRLHLSSALPDELQRVLQTG